MNHIRWPEPELRDSIGEKEKCEAEAMEAHTYCEEICN